MSTQDGHLIVEHRDGHCQKVKLSELTFLDSKELFDQYDWGKEAAESKGHCLCNCDLRGDAE